MKASTLISIIVTAAIAGGAGWFAARRGSVPGDAPTATATRKVAFYQSSMHPWIKSDKPGSCTICGMKLTPVYEGETGFEAGADMVVLPQSSIQVLNVATEEVRRQPLVRTLRVAGRIDDNDSRHRFVSAYLDGRIDKLSVNYVGAEVVEGEPLASFYSPMLSSAQREFLTLVRNAQSLQTNGAAALLGADHERLQRGSAERLRRLGMTEAQIEQLARGAEPEWQTEIRAPISGTVVQRFVYEGMYVKEGEKLFEIADFSTMWFLFDAYERDLAWIRPGQKVEITTPSVPGKVFSGEVTFIDPNLNEMTRSAKVRVEIPNPLIEENGRKRRQLLHRLYAEAVVRSNAPEALAVPRSAVLSPGSTPVAYVDLGGGNYQQRQLQLGRSGDSGWEVLGGLQAGERVVTQGNLMIDAQAQLNQAAHGVSHHTPTGMPSATQPTHDHSAAPGPTVVPSEALNDAQQKAARTLLAAVDSVAAALAADSVDRFNTENGKLHTALPALVESFRALQSWHPAVEKLNAVGHLGKAATLQEARKAFATLSAATVEFARSLRKQASTFDDVKIYRCPMTNKSFPGAPKSAEWIQLTAEVRNPYFGAEMIDCGTEVKP